MGSSEAIKELVGEVLLLDRSFSGSTSDPDSERYRPPLEENILAATASQGAMSRDRCGCFICWDASSPLGDAIRWVRDGD